MRALLSLVCFAILFSVPRSAPAVDGVLEINQTCAVQTGCFAGDGAGFPVTITGTGGSYRLTGPLSVSSATVDAISVGAAHVSIDLNGFTIAGPTTCSSAGATGADLVCSGTTAGVRGIDAQYVDSLSVHDGDVFGFGGGGIIAAAHARIMDVRVEQNAGNGIDAGDSAELTRVSSRLNAGIGIAADSEAAISNAVAVRNLFDGISVNNGAVIQASRSYQNGNDGFFLLYGGVLSESTTYSNAGDGVDARGGTLIRGNSFYYNGNNGAGYQINGYSSTAYVQNAMQRSGTDLGYVDAGQNAGGNTCGSAPCP